MGSIGDILGGIVYFGTYLVLTNSGRITGGAAGAYGVAFEGDRLEIVNTGRIETVSTDAVRGAIRFAGDAADTARIVNGPQGEIVSPVTAIRTGDGTETVRNAGTIQGDVWLGNGEDSFAGKGGRVIGEVRGEGGNDRLAGGDSDDRLFGGDGDDVMGGGAGDDAVIGDAGNDSIRGGTGEDRLSGGTGNDWLAGGAGEDDLQGGAGADTLTGGADDDVLTGGAQADVFLFRRGHGHDTVTDFQNNMDRLDLSAFGLAGFAALSALARDTSAGLLIDLGSVGGGTITLQGFLKAQFDAADVTL